MGWGGRKKTRNLVRSEGAGRGRLGPRDTWILVWGNRGTRGSEGGVQVPGRSKPQPGLSLNCLPTNLWTSPAFYFFELRERAAHCHRRPSLGVGVGVVWGVGLNLTARGPNGLKPRFLQTKISVDFFPRSSNATT